MVCQTLRAVSFARFGDLRRPEKYVEHGTAGAWALADQREDNAPRRRDGGHNWVELPAVGGISERCPTAKLGSYAGLVVSCVRSGPSSRGRIVRGSGWLMLGVAAER